MRLLVGIVLVFAMLHGCGDDDAAPSPGNDDASSPGNDAGPEPTPRSKLERPELPRPPNGALPDDLRPPR